MENNESSPFLRVDRDAAGEIGKLASDGTMKHIEEAFALHMRELHEFYRRASHIGSAPKISARRWREMQSEKWLKTQIEGYGQGEQKSRRGRPSIFDGGSERTNESYRAFLFVNREMRVFRHRNQIKRVPAEVRDAFIAIAKRMYPKASVEIILEHIRERKKLVPPIHND